MKITSVVNQVVKQVVLVCGVSAALLAQGRGGGAPPTAKAAAPVDYTGYWV